MFVGDLLRWMGLCVLLLLLTPKMIKMAEHTAHPRYLLTQNTKNPTKSIPTTQEQTTTSTTLKLLIY